VLKGGNLDIDADVTSPKGKVLYSEQRRQRDTFPLEVSVGTFAFCFSNEFSSLTHKIVHFSIRPSEADTRALAREVGKDAIKPGVMTMTEQMMETIHEHSTKVRYTTEVIYIMPVKLPINDGYLGYCKLGIPT